MAKAPQNLQYTCTNHFVCVSLPVWTWNSDL